MYRIRKTAAYRVIDGQAVIVDTGSDKMIMLNGTGTDVWRGIENGQTTEEITASIVGEYATDANTAKADVTAFVQLMLEKNLIEAT